MKAQVKYQAKAQVKAQVNDQKAIWIRKTNQLSLNVE